ncbi:DUF389 domain-containing protein [Streptomyces litmocidini]|uniref:DUF389 domain-containing protein n=1 Tax=Streptomyces litmocidini TaxID=67318 RepID=A0ABW7UGD2_9ACTN
MLFLSAVIAADGVLTDSTATVIGAMIIAPLSTPIMGIALGAAQRRQSTAALFVVAGGRPVVVLGALFSLVLPASYDLLSNSQISSRTSPGLMDLVAALATGFAGALALSRRDVAAALPGVAIAISLVPPLVVTGVCLGQAAWWLTLGSFVLFVSNLLALVFAGMVVFGGLGYATADRGEETGGTRRTYLALGLLFGAVGVLLAANTAATVLVQLWTTRATNSATRWPAASPGASVVNVSARSRTLYIQVRAPEDLPPVETLLADSRVRSPTECPSWSSPTQAARSRPDGSETDRPSGRASPSVVFRSAVPLGLADVDGSGLVAPGPPGRVPGPCRRLGRMPFDSASASRTNRRSRRDVRFSPADSSRKPARLSSPVTTMASMSSTGGSAAASAGRPASAGVEVPDRCLAGRPQFRSLGQGFHGRGVAGARRTGRVQPHRRPELAPGPALQNDQPPDGGPGDPVVRVHGAGVLPSRGELTAPAPLPGLHPLEGLVDGGPALVYGERARSPGAGGDRRG